LPLLEDLRTDVNKRLDELKPLVEEHAELLIASEALDAAFANGNGKPASKPRASVAKAGAVTKPAAKPAKAKTAGTGKRGRPAGSGNRANEVIALITVSPGLTIQGIAKKLGIKPNYLYRVLPTLEKEGKVVKRDDGYHVA
jgi:hypothetical protein